MSYRRSITRVIEIPYSGTAVKDSVAVHYSGTARETVVFNVEVDTSAFDGSVEACTQHVNILTDSVVATEVAQVASIKDNADKVGNTIISGFFKTVRSELGQQITQLKSSVDATLIHLNQLSKRCLEKRAQMEADYGRVAERYSKIFNDLNKELAIRVHELDKDAFNIEDDCQDCTKRTLESDLLGNTAVAASENSRLHSLLGASLAKRRAMDSLNKARTFLQKQISTKLLINNSLYDTDKARSIYVPVCVMRTQGPEGESSPTVYRNPQMQQIHDRQIAEFIEGKQWKAIPEADMGIIKKFYLNQINSESATDNPHDSRIRAYLTKFINDNTILSV